MRSSYNSLGFIKDNWPFNDYIPDKCSIPYLTKINGKTTLDGNLSQTVVTDFFLK